MTTKRTEYDNIAVIGNTMEDDNPDSNVTYNQYAKQAGFRIARAFTEKVPKGSVLDQGCSIGAWFPFFKTRGFKRVVGIDISKERLAVAVSRGYEGKLAPAQKLPFKPNSFDLVFCIDVLVHILQRKDRQAAMREAFRVLKPGAPYVVSIASEKFRRANAVVNFYALGKGKEDRLPTYVNWSTVDEVTTDLEKAGFEVESVEGTEFLYPSVLVYAPAVLKVYDKLFGRLFPGYGRIIYLKATKPR